MCLPSMAPAEKKKVMFFLLSLMVQLIYMCTFEPQMENRFKSSFGEEHFGIAMQYIHTVKEQNIAVAMTSLSLDQLCLLSPDRWLFKK